MSKQQEFLNFWNYLVHDVAGEIEVPADVQAYINAISKTEESGAKPLFTDNGKSILAWMKEAPVAMYRSKDIAEQIMISSKSVAGAMRKLVNDGYVEKIGNNPVVYQITDKGKTIDII